MQTTINPKPKCLFSLLGNLRTTPIFELLLLAYNNVFVAKELADNPEEYGKDSALSNAILLLQSSIGILSAKLELDIAVQEENYIWILMSKALIALYKSQQHQIAIEYLKDAQDQAENRLVANHPVVGIINILLAYVYQQQEDFEKGAQAANKAHQILRTKWLPNEPTAYYNFRALSFLLHEASSLKEQLNEQLIAVLN